jgi:general secretion pathway protein K
VTCDRQTDSGIALISVLWILMLLSLVSGALVALRRSETVATTNASARARALAIADAGIGMAVMRLADGRTSPHLATDGTPTELVFEGVPITIVVVSEAGKIDLNSGADGELKALIAYTGMSDDQAQNLVDAISDWRDEDDLRSPNGAEYADYAAVERAGPKNAPFVRVDELHDVLRVTPKIFAFLRPSLTVYSSRTFVDVRYASETILKAFRRKDDSIAIAHATDAERTFVGSSAETGAVAGPGALLNQAFCIRSTSHLLEGYEAKREVVVRITGLPEDPYWIHETGTDLGCGKPSE